MQQILHVLSFNGDKFYIGTIGNYLVKIFNCVLF